MIQPSNTARSGFTIIELMLAMGFVGLLLLAIAMTTIQIGTIYDRGTTLRQVNQSGRELTDELQRSIAASSSFDVTKSADSRYREQDGGGRLCVGKYSYVWNTGKALADGTAPNVYEGDASSVPIRFVKVADSGALLCSDLSNNIVQPSATDLLDSGDRDLVVHKFDIAQTTPSDPTTGQALYAITLTLGTNDRAELLTGDASCKPPSEGDGGEDYCAVNTFDIVARAGNKVGAE